MKIALTYSSKAGLLAEYQKRNGSKSRISEAPADFFAEGDSPQTIQAVMEAIQSGGHAVTGLEGDDRLPEQLEKLRPQLVFNIAEGLYGDLRESYVPHTCERLGIPHTGSDPLTLAICLNKFRTKEILGFYRIPTPAFRIFFPGQPVQLRGFAFPGIVKPVSEGSSKGIFDDSVVNSPVEAEVRIQEMLQRYEQPVLLEKFLNGAEFTVAIWGNSEETEILPIIEIDHSPLPAGANRIYSYEAKWVWDTTDNPLDIYKCPAEISPELRSSIEALCLKTYRALQIRDWCRIDIRLDEKGAPNVLELNPLPGILPDPRDNSCFPKAARTAGYTYEQMINKVISFAAKRYGIQL